jgi:gamma-D-glutamyl-L-lysine dipeptidyl-peptidase
MERFICENVYVPLRSGPTHKSEMLSQVLFGEKYCVVDRSGSWIKIETIFDKYQGWIDLDHLQDTPEVTDSAGYILNRSLLCYRDDRTKLVLEAGCEIYNPDFENRTFTIGKNIYTTSADFTGNFVETNESLADTAMRYINSPYIWGGRIPSGIDCSGLTQLVYKLHGISIPRESWKQAEAGKLIDFIDIAEAGDLVFFDNDRGKIAHVGMIISRGLVIHASGRVRIDTLDHQGIYKPEKKGYSHRLRIIKRIIQ